MNRQTVLITGATGFLGGRAAEKLHLGHGAQIRALVRRFSQAVRLARLPVAMIPGELSDPAALDTAVAGCDVVIHCAHDWGDRRRNQEGTRLLAETSLRHGVRRLVYVSSVAVYEPLPDGDVDETTPARPDNWEYAETKRAIEQMLLQFGAETGLPVVVLQPTCIYGPYSFPWTIHPIQQVCSGRVVLPDEGEGWCNSVYVDDVVDAMLLATLREDAIGERFLITGPAPITWREFYAAFERAAGVQSVICMPHAQIEAATDGPGASMRTLGRDPMRLIRGEKLLRLKRGMRHLLGNGLVDRAKGHLPAPLLLPDRQQLGRLAARARVRIDKARAQLGYEPAYDFQRGMAVTARYLEWAKLCRP
jgi:nucleoside-diphosphate-sugar epimerase